MCISKFVYGIAGQVVSCWWSDVAQLDITVITIFGFYKSSIRHMIDLHREASSSPNQRMKGSGRKLSSRGQLLNQAGLIATQKTENEGLGTGLEKEILE